MGSAVTVTVNGLARLEAKMNKLPDKVAEALARGVNQAAGLVEGSAKKLCPVDTNNLRGSLHIIKQATSREITATVGTNVEYAPYVEFGTGVYSENPSQSTWRDGSYHTIPVNGGKEFRRVKGTHAYPFLRPALRNNKDRIEQIINKNVAEGIK